VPVERASAFATAVELQVESNLIECRRHVRRRSVDSEEAGMQHAHEADTVAIQGRIAQLQAEHHDLDCLINRVAGVPGMTDTELQRLKKRKLKVKDTITLLQLQLEPGTHN
jgi:hypothetical protein